METTTANSEAVDEDPLDAYMAEISQKARAGAEVYFLLF